MKTQRLLIFGSMISIVLSISSCLKDGGEVISLEKGVPSTLLSGKWKVDNCYKLSSSENKKKEEMPMDPWVGTTFSCYPEGEYIENSNEKEGQYWSVSSTDEFSNPLLSLGAKSFNITSMGKSRMLIASSGKEYEVNKISEIGDETPWENYANTSRLTDSDARYWIRLNGMSIDVPKGSIPLNDNRRKGQLWITVSKVTDCPYSLPSGYKKIDQVYKCEPMGFIFQTPLLMTFDLRDHNPSEVKVLHYNDNYGRWEVMPFSNLKNGKAQISTNYLGYYVLVEDSASEDNEYGGICFNGNNLEPGYFYYLIIENAPDKTLCGKMTYSGSGNLYLPFIPKGSYTIRLARERKSAIDEAVTGIQNSQTKNITVSQTLVMKLTDFDKYTGWTMLDAAFVWNEGRPSTWENPTVTYGTGKFQATLTWVNTSSVSVDYDLHLQTPDDHIYFGSKGGHCFSLDRDWLRKEGNAVENIYSTDDNFTPGNYRLYVNHYSGDSGVRYNCRVLVNGYTVTSYSGITSSGNRDIYSFTVER